MSSLPPWGTSPEEPTSHPASADPGRSRAPGPADRPGAPMEFALVVEQQKGNGQSMQWRADPPPRHLPSGTSRAEAERAALALARTFSPDHPWAKGDRTVYRLDAGAFLVVMQGATRNFHFRVSVAEPIP